MLVITHGLAGFASLANGLPWLYKLAVFTFVGISFYSYLCRYYFQFQSYQISNNSVGWQLAVIADDFQTIQILPSSVITVWLIVLHFRLENGKFQSLVLLNDALESQDYRALVVALKIAGLCQEKV